MRAPKHHFIKAEGLRPLQRYLCANDLAGLQALGANVSLVLIAILLNDGDLLDVGTEGTVGDTVGVADAATSGGVLTTNRANLRHFLVLLASING